MMTIEELEQENLTLREVLHDLKKFQGRYEVWIAKNEREISEKLQEMAVHYGR